MHWEEQRENHTSSDHYQKQGTKLPTANPDPAALYKHVFKNSNPTPK